MNKEIKKLKQEKEMGDYIHYFLHNYKEGNGIEYNNHYIICDNSYTKYHIVDKEGNIKEFSFITFKDRETAQYYIDNKIN